MSLYYPRNDRLIIKAGINTVLTKTTAIFTAISFINSLSLLRIPLNSSSALNEDLQTG